MLEAYRDTISILKDLTSIVTPFALAAVGLAINASLQRQGKISDRNAHIAKSWADEFAKITKSVNDISTEILFSYWAAKNADILSKENGEDIFINKINNNLHDWAIRLKRHGYELEPFASMAKSSGIAFMRSFHSLDEYLYNWLKNSGGNIDELRRLQKEFNARSWDVHAELVQRSV